MRITHSLITELIEKTENKPLSHGNNLLENREAKKEIERSMELVFSNGSNQVNANFACFQFLIRAPYISQYIAWHMAAQSCFHGLATILLVI